MYDVTYTRTWVERNVIHRESFVQQHFEMHLFIVAYFIKFRAADMNREPTPAGMHCEE